jgi:hypothetical protein
MSATMSLNGKPRTQLADQLDRLDAILDVLGDGLTAAVADAMKAGTAVAVKETLVEVLTNPDLLATLRAGLAGAEATPNLPVTAGPAKQGLFARLRVNLAAAKSAAVMTACRVKGSLGRAATAVRTKLARGAATVVTRAAKVTRAVTAVATLTHVIRHARRAAMTAVILAALVGVLGLFAPHLLTAAVSGLTAAVTVVGLGARDGARRVLALN